MTDEVDAIGAKRYESQSGGEREIQRTMLELLNQMDGFDARGDVKVLCGPHPLKLMTVLQYGPSAYTVDTRSQSSPSVMLLLFPFADGHMLADFSM